MTLITIKGLWKTEWINEQANKWMNERIIESLNGYKSSHLIF